jgi:hypothetical protein
VAARPVQASRSDAPWPTCSRRPARRTSTRGLRAAEPVRHRSRATSQARMTRLLVSWQSASWRRRRRSAGSSPEQPRAGDCCIRIRRRGVVSPSPPSLLLRATGSSQARPAETPAFTKTQNSHGLPASRRRCCSRREAAVSASTDSLDHVAASGQRQPRWRRPRRIPARKNGGVRSAFTSDVLVANARAPLRLRNRLPPQSLSTCPRWTSSRALVSRTETAASARRSGRPRAGATPLVSLPEAKRQRCPRRLSACTNPDPGAVCKRPQADQLGAVGARSRRGSPGRRARVSPRAIVTIAATGRALRHGRSSGCLLSSS